MIWIVLSTAWSLIGLLANVRKSPSTCIPSRYKTTAKRQAASLGIMQSLSESYRDPLASTTYQLLSSLLRRIALTKVSRLECPKRHSLLTKCQWESWRRRVHETRGRYPSTISWHTELTPVIRSEPRRESILTTWGSLETGRRGHVLTLRMQMLRVAGRQLI